MELFLQSYIKKLTKTKKNSGFLNIIGSDYNKFG